MENKELFDQVIGEISTNPIDEIDMNDGMTEEMERMIADEMDNHIQLKISTGETYLIDPNTFDWDQGVKNLASMYENVDSLNKMMFALLSVENPNEPEANKMIDETTEQLITFLRSFQIEPIYEQFDPNITKYKKLLFMIFDANNITRTMIHNIEMYESLNSISMMFDHNAQCKCDACTSNINKLEIFKITIVDTEGGPAIDKIELGDCKLDEIGIPEYEDGKTIIHVQACSIHEAREQVISLIKGSSDESVIDDDHNESGLLSE